MNKKTAGIILILFAALAWALEALFFRFALDYGNVLEISAYTSIFALIPPAIYAMFKKSKWKLQPKKWRYVILIGIFGLTVPMFLYYYALSETYVLNATLIVHMQPFFILFLGYFIFREKLNRYDYLGGIIMFFAATIVIARSFANLIQLDIGNVGDLLAIISTIFYAWAGIIAKKHLMDIDSAVLSFYRFGIAALILTTIAYFYSELKLASFYPLVIGLITGIGIILYYESLKRLKTAQVGFFELSDPVFASILAWIFLGELVTPTQFIGMLILFFGVYLIFHKGYHN